MRIRVNPDLLDTSAKQIQTSCAELVALAGKLSTAMQSMDIESQQIAPVRSTMEQAIKVANDHAARGNELAKLMTTKAALFRQIDADGAKGIGTQPINPPVTKPTNPTIQPRVLPPFEKIALKQGDYYKVVMNNSTGENVGSYGCLMTVMSMLCRTYGVEMNPRTLDSWNDSHNAYQNGSNMPVAAQEKFLRETLGTKYPELKNAEMVEIYRQKTNDGKIINGNQSGYPNPGKEIQAGKPVLLHIDSSSNPNDGHFVLAYGLSSKGDYVCADPATGKYKYISPTAKEIRSARVFK